MIRLESICVDFGGLRAIDHASFEVEAGRITGLIGPNGAGKTTAFNVIAGAVRPSAGRVLFDGKDITGLKPYQRAQRGLARTFQIPHEFTRLTVLENLMAAASAPEGENVFNVVFRRGSFDAEERAIYDRARETVRFLELEHVIDVPAGNLSGGQKKLVELGRALMRDPKIILLDEIGAGINRTLLGKLADKIKLLNTEQGLTFCLIEHDLDYVSRLCDHVLVMAQGQLLTEGTVDQVRNDERVIEAYFGGGKYEAQA
ncbi:MAG: ABC transporter ATP-binding protein [Rhizobiaceae bacterium]|uniref:ABC transporter ATP-binding protein n=1 Tax=Mesorhizobium sp. Z1-4 TaxID=2448478 RepID=UPI000FD7AB09|nr:ABC transporter ATP-binding protein [Mesorhizobium sp. Z1-4]MBO6901634.1 ABC transporter ATP-binding protein [Rhizobiaceae bacterium]